MKFEFKEVIDKSWQSTSTNKSFSIVNKYCFDVKYCEDIGLYHAWESFEQKDPDMKHYIKRCKNCGLLGMKEDK